VSDPLAAENACACVAGYAHRNYRMLGEVLAKELGRPVEVVVASTVESARTRLEGQPDVMIGKASEIEAEGRPGQCLARLTDTRGGVVFQCVLVVRSDDTAQRVADVAGYRLLFGPATCAEKHEAAFELLRTFGCAVPDKPETADTCTLAARQVAESGQGGRGVAAFISDYALPLLVGCETVDPGTLRVIGRTGPVPFIGAYASGHLPKEEAAAVQAALLAVSRRSRLRKALESRDGFVRPEALPAESVAEPADLPEKLPETLAVRWRRALSAQSLGGLAGRARYLIVSDKDDAET
jgi:ABC-type phosphate/phosphonate transport system substrate-binding protein